MLRLRIREAIEAGAAGLQSLAGQVVVIGNELMDLYTGLLNPQQIGCQVISLLEHEGRLGLAAYRPWIAEAGGYRMVTFPEDQSRWVLRRGEEAGRYVHVHPGRRTPQTVRTRANVLKTALMVLVHAGLYGSNPLDVAIVDSVRREYLALPPLGRELSGKKGLGEVIELLRSEETGPPGAR